jgi:hypothetical protein
VRVTVRLDSGEELEAVLATLAHPAVGDRVRVEIDPAGIIELDGD